MLTLTGMLLLSTCTYESLIYETIDELQNDCALEMYCAGQIRCRFFLSTGIAGKVK